MVKPAFKITRCAALFAAFIICGISGILSAQIPKSATEIPVFPGAVRDKAKEAERVEQTGFADDPTLRSFVVHVFTIDKSLEDVFAFYLQKIGGKTGVLEQDPGLLDPGTLSGVFYEIEHYTEEDFKNASVDADQGRNPGKWMRENLQKYRKPHQPGKWIKQARFEWMKKEANNDLTMFFLILFDTSFESAPNAYKTSTEIEVQATTTKSEEAMDQEAEENEEQDVESLTRSLQAHPPTEKDLGVPIYPGARFDARNSAGMTAGNDNAVYQYFTDDPPSKVAAFYELKLKIKPVLVAKDQYMIPVKGQMPLPKEGIIIQPNLIFKITAKTMISIQRAKEQEEEE